MDDKNEKKKTKSLLILRLHRPDAREGGGRRKRKNVGEFVCRKGRMP